MQAVKQCRPSMAARRKISQIVAPIVSMGRKLSRREELAEESEDEEDTGDDGLDDITAQLDIPLDFISQMKEAFYTFDKVVSNTFPYHD